MLDDGHKHKTICKKLKLNKSTLSKYLQQGFLIQRCNENERRANLIKDIFPSIQKKLDDHLPKTEISKTLNISVSTINKYIKLGHLVEK